MMRRKMTMLVQPSGSAGDVGREEADYGGAVREVRRALQPGRGGLEG